MRLDAHGFPLFEVRAVAWSPPAADTVDALLIGSANALRQGGDALARYRGMPAYAVGRTSADAARAAGLDVIASGEAGLQALLGDLRPEHRRLLRLAGEARTDLAPPRTVTIVERVVYASQPQPMPPALAELLRRPALVLLHSGEAARHFARLCDRHGIARTLLSLAAIGPRVAAAAGCGWRAVAAAARPDDTALLALARRMCQTGAGSENFQDRA
jgi:uroporphyrinogen-III synthase